MYKSIVPVMLIVSAFVLAACGREPQEDGGAAGPAADKRPVIADVYSAKRNDMVTYQLEARGITDRPVLDAMRKVPRHLFVPSGYRDEAYEDTPLPIGFGQTISQPYIVALMTGLLELDGNSKVLEVGTGSGYQAAILAQITHRVYTVEIVKELHERSGRDLKNAGYTGVRTLCADGYYGWEEHAPYDAIIVTCASEFIPPPLVRQLKKGGTMCIPVGPPFKVQHLLLVRKTDNGEVNVEMITEVRFVPLVRAVR